MGFSVRIEADYGSEILSNWHPDGKQTDGKAVLAFLTGLDLFCGWSDDNYTEDDISKNIVYWYQLFERTAEVRLCASCRSLLDCMWGDGGDHTEYHADDYEFYKYRASYLQITQTQFQSWLQASEAHWKPINEVIDGVRLRLYVFRHAPIQSLEGFYVPEDTLPDFEALYANLNLLAQRGNQMIRLNFS